MIKSTCTQMHKGMWWQGKQVIVLLGTGLFMKVVLELAIVSPATAQITPDNSLGVEKSIVTSDVIKGLPSDRITGGAMRGTNLFHSFQQFVINEGRGAYFDPGASITNIFSRVTGGRSDVLGTLGILNNANLYLISPNGILFGPNARLDLKGSFVATTASGVNFPDGNQYNTTNQDSPPLIIAVPIGLQFGSTPGDILVQRSDLKVAPGQTLALVGGNLAFDGGNVSATGGRIELGSVTGNNQVQLNPTSNGLVLGFSGVENFQRILAINGALINAGEPGGTLTVTGKELVVSDGSQLSTTTFGTGNAGDLTIRATELVELKGASSNGFASGLFARVNSGAEGKGGNLLVETKRLVIRGGAIVNASTDGKGDAGNITVRADSINVTGSRVGMATGVGEGAEGNGGDLTIETRQLNIGNSQVSTSTFGLGNAGDLTIRAAESISLDRGGLFAQVLSTSGRKGGNLNISTGKLQAVNGSVISTSSLGLGTAGDLNVAAQSITLRRSKILAETNSGNGGNINLQVQGLLLMTRGSTISTTAGAAGAGGNGGNITINSDFILTTPRNSNSITANAFDGSGGKISITTRGLFGFLEGIQDPPKSFISASSTRGISGQVIVTTLDTNPSRAVIELPSTVIDPSKLISQNCRAGQRLTTQGRFVIEGKQGEIPVPNPGEVLVVSAASSDRIVEAQGLTRAGKNDEWVVLTAAGMSETTPTFGVPAGCYEE